MTDLRVSEVRFTPAPIWWKEKGLLGWVSCVLDKALGVGGLGVRRTADGRMTLSFPGAKDRNGDLHHHVWPMDSATRESIESQVMGELRSLGVLP